MADERPREDAQLSLIGLTAAQARRERARAAADAPAERVPVARVVLSGMLPHLDREFDYLVPARLADDAVPGVRVIARMAGKDVEGFLVERRDLSEYEGQLKPLRRVVSSLPVLTPALLETCRRVAADHGGGLGDVLRLAVPPRHARAEQQALASELPTVEIPPTEPGDWSNYLGGEAFLRRLGLREAPRAIWTALPSGGRHEQSWAAQLARAALTVAGTGKGVIVVVPDGRDVERMMSAVEVQLPGAGDGLATRLTHDLGPAARYAAFVSALTGRARIVVGTRQAAWAPIPELGLLICWDDLDSHHREPRAPYPSTLRIIRARAGVEGCAVLVGSCSRSLKAQEMVETDWAKELAASRDVVRARSARVQVTGDAYALERDPGARSRLPAAALAAARRSLASELPVLVQVPRLGYLRTLSCQECRNPARCRHCRGPLATSGPDQIPSCHWCGRPAADFECPICQGSRVRAVIVGSDRTAEEIGRALPKARIVNSSGGRIKDTVEGGPVVVVATPGGEPVVEGGYGVVLILDAWLTLARPTLDADEVALWRWLRAVSLVRPASEAGEVVLVGPPEAAVVQALLRHDPVGSAIRQLAERCELHLPPASVFAEVSGAGHAVHDLLARLDVPDGTAVLGPVQVTGANLDALAQPQLRCLLRVPSQERAGLALALRQALVRLSSAHGGLPRVQVGVIPDA